MNCAITCPDGAFKSQPQMVASWLRKVLDGNEIDLVVLDLIMPGEDGFALTDMIRRNCDSGIIILSAVGDPADQVLGLELGADDYVTKPCDPRALLARIRSVLRRRAEIVPGGTPTHINCLEFSGYRLLPSSRQFLSANKHEIPLTTAEFDLLELLVKNPGPGDDTGSTGWDYEEPGALALRPLD